MTVTPERQESVDFSDSYAKGVQVIIVPEGSDIQSPDDLEGKNIGVQTGTTGDTYCTGDYGQEHVKQFNNCRCSGERPDRLRRYRPGAG